MIERDRVLRPLREAEPAITSLDTYESPAVLTEALRATWHAVEQSLRTLLRSDDTASEEIRLTAMSATALPTDPMLRELRRRDLVSVPLAARLHEFRQALDRADVGEVRAADADTASDVLRLLQAEVERLARARRPSADDVDMATMASAGPTTSAGSASAAPAAASAPAGASSSRAGASSSRASAPLLDAVSPGLGAGPDGSAGLMRAWRLGPRRPLWMIAGVVTVLVVLAVVLLTRGGGADMARGVEAFREGRMGLAEQHFRTVLSRDEDNVTARLYLARILREQARLQEAADLLRNAARMAPDDAAVRRELGYLFLDLDRPPSAVEQFRTAVELEPDESLNWVGLVVALRRAGDRSADEWLRRAPAEARALLGSERP